GNFLHQVFQSSIANGCFSIGFEELLSRSDNAISNLFVSLASSHGTSWTAVNSSHRISSSAWISIVRRIVSRVLVKNLLVKLDSRNVRKLVILGNFEVCNEL